MKFNKYSKSNNNRNNKNELKNDDVKIINNLSYNSNLTKNDFIIQYLIDKRIKYCQLDSGASIHIAALIPKTIKTRYCLIYEWQWKICYG